MRLENKVALITGGYGGMGRASARLFCQEGATVFVAGRNQGRGDAFVKELTDAGGPASFTAEHTKKVGARPSPARHRSRG